MHLVGRPQARIGELALQNEFHRRRFIAAKSSRALLRRLFRLLGGNPTVSLGVGLLLLRLLLRHDLR
jgi:hypothetical protein